MREKKLFRSSINTSKKRSRRFRSILDKASGLHIRRRFLPLFLFFLFAFLLHNLFVVRYIECTLDNDKCSVEISEKVDKFVGTNMLILNQDRLSDLIKSAIPVDKVNIGFKVFNTLSIKIEGKHSPYNTQIYLIGSPPMLGMDSATVSSESAYWTMPTQELEKYSQGKSFSSFNLWDNGTLTPEASSESRIKYFISEKPDAEKIKSVYSLLKLVDRYLNASHIYVLQDNVFLRQLEQPDIIVSVPFDEGSLVEVFQSIGYLATIKKDAKVIDLRFKNPIIR